MTELDRLALDLHAARCQLQDAGRALHDHAGPLLSAAGIQLQLLRLDHPQTADAIKEVLSVLDQATERIRTLSRTLDPSPAAHVGLARALSQLVERIPLVTLAYSSTIKPPPAVAAVIFETVALVLARFEARKSRTPIRVTGTGTARRLSIRILSKSLLRWPRSEVTAISRRLAPAGVFLEVITKESTIVSISYAARRATRR